MNPDRVGLFCRLVGSEFLTEGAMNLSEHSQKDFKLCFRIFKSSHLRIGIKQTGHTRVSWGSDSVKWISAVSDVSIQDPKY